MITIMFVELTLTIIWKCLYTIAADEIVYGGELYVIYIYDQLFPF